MKSLLSKSFQTNEGGKIIDGGIAKATVNKACALTMNELYVHTKETVRSDKERIDAIH
jgi:hypothetical protein